MTDMSMAVCGSLSSLCASCASQVLLGAAGPLFILALALTQGCALVALPDLSLSGRAQRVVREQVEEARRRAVYAEVRVQLTFRERVRATPRSRVFVRALRFSPFPCALGPLCRWEAAQRRSAITTWERENIARGHGD